MNPFQKNPKHASVLAERYFYDFDTFFAFEMSLTSYFSRMLNSSIRA